MTVIEHPVLVFGLCMIFTAFVGLFEGIATRNRQHVVQYIRFYIITSLGVIFFFQLLYVMFPSLQTLSIAK